MKAEADYRTKGELSDTQLEAVAGGKGGAERVLPMEARAAAMWKMVAAQKAVEESTVARETAEKAVAELKSAEKAVPQW
jgi:hypothetical protein